MKKEWISIIGLLLATQAAQAQLMYDINYFDANTAECLGFGDVVSDFAVISNIYMGLPVTSIASEAFIDCTSLTGVSIPGSVTSIQEGSFEDCTGLTNVNLTGSLVFLGEAAFESCYRLASVAVPGSVSTIQAYAFDSCPSLTSASIGNGVASIEEFAFTGCGMASVTFPVSMSVIGAYAFSFCPNLHSAYFQGNAPTADSSVFEYNTNVTVYFLPGTTGWKSTFGGAPTALWNPIIQAGGSSFGVRNNQFGFNITGTANIPIVVEACTNLANLAWTPLQTITLTNGLFYFSEPLQAGKSVRYYRVSAP